MNEAKVRLKGVCQGELLSVVLGRLLLELDCTSILAGGSVRKAQRVHKHWLHTSCKSKTRNVGCWFSDFLPWPRRDVNDASQSLVNVWHARLATAQMMSSKYVLLCMSFLSQKSNRDQQNMHREHSNWREGRKQEASSKLLSEADETSTFPAGWMQLVFLPSHRL